MACVLSPGLDYGESAHHSLDIADTIELRGCRSPTVGLLTPARCGFRGVGAQHDDRTFGIDRHIDQAFVAAGTACDKIATVGNRGRSTVPHLRHDVRSVDGSRMDPVACLSVRGVQTGALGAGIGA